MSTPTCFVRIVFAAVVLAWPGSQAAHATGPAALPLSIRPGRLVLERPALPGNHIEALGERAGIWGSLADGLEAWVYPFKLFDGLQLAISTDGGQSYVPAQQSAQTQIATPHQATLKFAADDWRMAATLFVPRSLPGMLLLLKLESRDDLEYDLTLRFRPVLAPMHLQAAHDLETAWDAGRGELIVAEPGRKLELRVGSPCAMRMRVLKDGEVALQLRVPRKEARRGLIPVSLSLGFPDQPSALATADRLRAEAGALLAEARQYYADLLQQAPAVASPDPAVNDALAWSVVSLDQLRVRNPYLGYGLVSGYSSSGRSTVPRYCWFFEEPTLTLGAFHWAGLAGHVREALRFLQRYQRADGKTVHEVIQSLPFRTNYFQTSHYAYKHSDGPVYYLFAYGYYYQLTGDLDFIRAEWPHIRRTLSWCFRATDPEDGLIQIEPGDWGSAESSTGVWKDTQLQGMWVRALGEVAVLARECGEPALAQRCQRTAAQARASLEAKLWDEAAGTYLWGLDRQGRPLQSLVPHHAVSFWLGRLREDRVRRALERMAAADFCTDWGVRSLALSDPQYSPQHYQAGAVWPVWNAGVIVSDYRHQRGVEAFRNWRAMVRARTLDGLGPMPEVLDGRFFQRLKGGAPHQMFSELAVMNGFFDGLLGLQLEAPAKQIVVAPTLPPGWERLKVERIPCGPGWLDLKFQQTLDDFKLTFHLHTFRGAVLKLAPRLPAGARIGSVLLDGKPAEYTVRSLPEVTIVKTELMPDDGPHILRIRHSGGIQFAPVDEPLSRGGVSRNLRIIRAGLQGDTWRMVLEGLPGKTYAVDWFTRRKPALTPGGPAIERIHDGFRLRLTAPSTGATNAAGFVRWASGLPLR